MRKLYLLSSLTLLSFSTFSQGAKVSSLILHNSDWQMNTRHLANGVYFARTTINGQVFNHKIVITK